MKILFCIPNFALGGVERRLSQLIVGLDRNTDYELFCIVNSDTCVYPQVKNTRLAIIKAPNQVSKRKEFVLKTIENIKPDIVHCWNLSFAFLCSLAKLKQKHKFKLISGTITSSYKYPIYRKDFYKELFVFKLSDVIVANSIAGVNAKNAPLNKTQIIYNGFDYSRLANLKSTDLIRDTYGIKTKYIVSMASRVNEQKDIKTFIDVAAKMSLSHDDITFILIGDGTLLDYYKQYAKDLGIQNLVFTGLSKDVESIINASAIYVQCSKHPEGLSNSILEACAIGKPVIATHSGGTCEIVEDNYNGYLVNKADVAAIAQKTEILLLDAEKRQTMGENAQKLVQQKFLLETMVDKYIELYNKLA